MSDSVHVIPLLKYQIIHRDKRSISDKTIIGPRMDALNRESYNFQVDFSLILLTLN